MRKSRENGLFLNVPDEQWNDWKWQVENRIETLEDLKKYITLTEEEEEGSGVRVVYGVGGLEFFSECRQQCVRA